VLHFTRPPTKEPSTGALRAGVASMINAHTINTPHGPAELLYVESPPAWKGWFNSPDAMAKARRYVYHRRTTNEVLRLDYRGRIVDVD
jgi:hypothetical protein